MLVSFSHIPLIGRVLQRTSRPANQNLVLRKGIAARAVTTSLVAALAFSLTACQTVETPDLNQPLPPTMTPVELVIATKASWEATLADFYRDDWEKMNEHVARLEELVARWRAEKFPPEREEIVKTNVDGFAEAVTALRQAVQTKNVEASTDALRRIGKRVADFEAMR